MLKLLRETVQDTQWDDSASVLVGLLLLGVLVVTSPVGLVAEIVASAVRFARKAA